MVVGSPSWRSLRPPVGGNPGKKDAKGLPAPRNWLKSRTAPPPVKSDRSNGVPKKGVKNSCTGSAEAPVNREVSEPESSVM